LWLGPLREITGARYKTSTSGDTVVFRSSVGTVTVDPRTSLIRSEDTTAAPQGGVPAYHATYSYPSSVQELGAPAPLCR